MQRKNMSTSKPSRRDFLKSSAIAGLGASLAGISGGCAAHSGPGETKAVTLSSGIVLKPDIGRTRPRPAGQKPVYDLATARLEKVRVAVIGLNRGLTHVTAALNIEFADVVAVCDWRDDRAKTAADLCAEKRGKRPAVYSGTEHIWEQMVDRDDIDVVYIATPWAWHVPMALRTMERGKHSFVEVAAAVTVDDC
jgi:Oxidoreductase family, NAD-binding Rossmann fold/TAT (twin-arginine translocation) pathway signal sequence